MGARSLFTRLRDLVPPGGRVIGCTPSSDVLATLASGRKREGAEGSTLSDGGGFGNELFRFDFDSTLQGLSVDDTMATFGERWGISYKFTLVDAVRELQEYVVPWFALETLINELGFRVYLEGKFPEILEVYKPASRFFNDVFSKDAKNADLNATELGVFELYVGFVLIRTDANAEALLLKSGDAGERRAALDAL